MKGVTDIVDGVTTIMQEVTTIREELTISWTFSLFIDGSSITTSLLTGQSVD